MVIYSDRDMIINSRRSYLLFCFWLELSSYVLLLVDFPKFCMYVIYYFYYAGTLKDLEKPCVAFIRLARGEMLNHISEVPLPVRFMFICVGPPIEDMDYVEIGRSLSTLMANQVSLLNYDNKLS